MGYLVIAVKHNVATGNSVDFFSMSMVVAVKHKSTHYVILRLRLLICSMTWTEGKGHGISRRSVHRLDNMPSLEGWTVIDFSFAKVSHKVSLENSAHLLLIFFMQYMYLIQANTHSRVVHSSKQLIIQKDSNPAQSRSIQTLQDPHTLS